MVASHCSLLENNALTRRSVRRFPPFQSCSPTFPAAAGSLAVGCILIFLGGLRALRRGTNIEVVGGGYQAAPAAIVVTEGDAGKSKSKFSSRMKFK